MKPASHYGMQQCPACGSWVMEVHRSRVLILPTRVAGEWQPGTGDEYWLVGCSTPGCKSVRQ